MNFARILSHVPKKCFPCQFGRHKKSFSRQFGCHYFYIKAFWAPFLLRFSVSFRGSRRFCPDFMGFCPDFHQIKPFGGATAPPLPTPVALSHLARVEPRVFWKAYRTRGGFDQIKYALLHSRKPRRGKKPLAAAGPITPTLLFVYVAYSIG